LFAGKSESYLWLYSTLSEYWESKAINKNEKSKVFANYFTGNKRNIIVNGWVLPIKSKQTVYKFFIYIGKGRQSAQCGSTNRLSAILEKIIQLPLFSFR